MKIWKRMITVIVAAIMMLCVVPAQVSADEKLPTPTGLKWNTEHNFPMMGIWDRMEDYKDSIDKFKLSVVYSGRDGTDTPVYSEAEIAYNDGYQFDDFFDIHGTGYYSFTVQAIAKEGSGYENSDVAESEPVNFHQTLILVRTVDAEDTTIEADGGHAFFEACGGGKAAYDGAEFFYPDGTEVTISACPETGYLLRTFLFNPSDDVTVEGNKATFTHNQAQTVDLIFKDCTEVVNIKFDFGANHKAFAEQVCDLVIADGKTASVEGSVLTLEWTLADQVYGPASYLTDLIYEEIGGSGSPYISDGDEALYAFNGFGFGPKPMADYADWDEFYGEEQKQSTKDLTADLELYAHWLLPAEKAGYVFELPVDGTDFSFDTSNYSGVNTPAITASADSDFDAGIFTAWVDPETGRIMTEGTIEGGKTYRAIFYPAIKIGYFVADFDQIELTVANSTHTELNEEGFAIADIVAGYEISFDGNGGEGEMEPMVVPGTFAAPDCDFTNEDWSFAGWKIEGDDHVYAEGEDITITGNVTLVAQWAIPEYSFEEGPFSWYKGGGDLKATVHRSIDDDLTFEMFEGEVYIDETLLVEGDDYTVTPGSLNIVFKAGTLEQLEEGEHTVGVVFNDGEAMTTLTISTKSVGPDTSDSNNMLMYLMVMAITSAAALYCGLFKIRRSI